MCVAIEICLKKYARTSIYSLAFFSECGILFVCLFVTDLAIRLDKKIIHFNKVQDVRE